MPFNFTHLMWRFGEYWEKFIIFPLYISKRREWFKIFKLKLILSLTKKTVSNTLPQSFLINFVWIMVLKINVVFFIIKNDIYINTCYMKVITHNKYAITTLWIPHRSTYNYTHYPHEWTLTPIWKSSNHDEFPLIWLYYSCGIYNPCMDLLLPCILVKPHTC